MEKLNVGIAPRVSFLKDGVKKVAIRRANIDDITRIQEIMISAWNPIYRSYKEVLGKEIFETLFGKWKERRLKKMNFLFNKGRLFFIAELDGRIIGYTSYHVSVVRSRGEIAGNAVDPEARGLGIGTLLCQRVKEEFQNLGLIYARVTTGNDSAHKSARSVYNKIGLRKAIYFSDFFFNLTELEYRSCRNDTLTDLKLSYFISLSPKEHFKAVMLLHHAQKTAYTYLKNNILGKTISFREISLWSEPSLDMFRNIRHGKDDFGIVLTSHQDIVGICYVSLSRRTRVADIKAIFVAPKWRKKGIAKILLKKGFFKARKSGMRFARLKSNYWTEDLDIIRSLCGSVGSVGELPAVKCFCEIKADNFKIKRFFRLMISSFYTWCYKFRLFLQRLIIVSFQAYASLHRKY